jgi:hypothetical protein
LRCIPLACAFALAIAMFGRLADPFLPASANGIAKLWNSQYERWISREKFVPALEAEPGKQLVLIHYNPATHSNDDAWTFNLANLDTTKIVWARESSDPDENQRLIDYFKDRKVWLAEPDANPKRIIRYPGLRE